MFFVIRPVIYFANRLLRRFLGFMRFAERSSTKDACIGRFRFRLTQQVLMDSRSSSGHLFANETNVDSRNDIGFRGHV